MGVSSVSSCFTALIYVLLIPTLLTLTPLLQDFGSAFVVLLLLTSWTSISQVVARDILNLDPSKLEALENFIKKVDVKLGSYKLMPFISQVSFSMNQHLEKQSFLKTWSRNINTKMNTTIISKALKPLSDLLKHVATSFICAALIIANSVPVIWGFKNCLNSYFFAKEYSIYAYIPIFLIIIIILHYRIPHVISQALSWHFPEYKIYKPGVMYWVILISTILSVTLYFNTEVSGSEIYQAGGLIVREHRGRVLIILTLLVSLERFLVNDRLVKEYINDALAFK